MEPLFFREKVILTRTTPVRVNTNQLPPKMGKKISVSHNAPLKRMMQLKIFLG